MSSLYRALIYIPEKDNSKKKDAVVKFLFAKANVEAVFEKIRTIYVFSRDYWLENNDIPTRQVLLDALEKTKDKTLVEKLSDLPYPELNEVKYLFNKEEEVSVKQDLAKLIALGSAELSNPKTSSTDIRNLLMSGILDLESKFERTLVDGNIKNEAEQMVEAYYKAKNNEEIGNPTGFSKIDECTRGIKKGELWVISAYTSEGKSMFLANLMWTNAVLFGRNVVYASGEMPREQIRQWVLARHSQHPKFQDMGVPIGISEIRDGSLSPAQEKFLLNTVIPDLTNNKSYGEMQIFQIYPGMTTADLYRTLKFYRSQMEIDLFEIDMIQHLSSDKTINDKWQIELQENIKAVKQMAITFNNGEKLAVAAGYQVSRSARDAAEKKDGYDLSSLAYTAEAERSADVSLWILRRDLYKKVREVRLGMNKNRGGSIMDPYMVMERYDKAYVGEYPKGYTSQYVPQTEALPETEDNDFIVSPNAEGASVASFS